MPSNSGVFSVLPDNFFSPLVWANRRHYAALLVLYYRLFQENSSHLERELVVQKFQQYISQHRDTLAEENDETESPQEPSTNKEDVDSNLSWLPDVNTEMSPSDALENDRALASRFLRRLIGAGWLSEETLADFTKVINITAYARPFLESLARVDGGLKTEYESHVVNVYSSLCGEAVKENGHFTVVTAHEEARALVDSLKVLSQSIKGFYDNLNADAVRSKAAQVLHEHYDVYAGEVLDKAYKRLKTSDNVSRYRQRIFRKIADLLHDDAWLDASASKYLRIRQTSQDECRQRIAFMLEEIRDDLKTVDPLEDEIDRRNAAYSRSSTEIIKAYIEPDSTIAGKMGVLIKALYGGNEPLREHFAHGLFRIGFLSPSTLVPRRRRDEGNFTQEPSRADIEALDQTEAEFFERLRKQMHHSPDRISLWLDEQGGKERSLASGELVDNEDSYIRFVYALLYGDSRKNFGYRIEEDEKADALATDSGFVVPNIRFRRRNNESGH
jgi:hypothetical protein